MTLTPAQMRSVQGVKMRTEALRQRIEVLLRYFPELSEDEELRFDTLDAETEIRPILTNAVISSMLAESYIDGINHSINRLEERKEKSKRRLEFFRKLIQEVMETANLTRVDLPEGILTLQSAPQRVLINDESKLPEDMFRVTKAVDKTKIKNELKDGKSVPGAELSNGGTMLVIR